MVALKRHVTVFNEIVTFVDLTRSSGPWFNWLISETVIRAIIMPAAPATNASRNVRLLLKLIEV